MDEILDKIKRLMALHKAGKLGGEKMPEDSNPGLAPESDENYLYFTLPMALNYQRNSYKLWEAAYLTYQDSECRAVFCPEKVLKMSDNELRTRLTKYKVAIQPNKQPMVWRKLCETLSLDFGGSVKNLLCQNGNDIKKIKEYIVGHKKQFPYLSGTKILNYWLYVLTTRTATKFTSREEITVAPDTHVLQASVKLGVISNSDLAKNNVRELVSQRWSKILKPAGIQPIDIHTPLWLWSRGGFKVDIS